MDGALTVASWTQEARERTGLTGVSPIWDDAPAWHFWISDAAGAYQLQMEQTWRDGPDGSGPCRGLFSIKFFPRKESPLLEVFSFYERELVNSEHFDNTDTPRFESRALIPAPLFVVGTMEMAYDPEDRWLTMSLEGLDSMRAVYRDEAMEECDLVELSRFHAANEVGRQVPGWALSFGLFDRLISLYSFKRTLGPARVALLRSPGFETVFTDAEGWVCSEDSPTTTLSAHVAFGEDPDSTAVATSLLDAEIGRPEASLLYDFAPHCRNPEHVLAGLPDSPYVNPLWWEIACVDRKSGLTSLCGCS